MKPARYKNYIIARTRNAEAEEVPWVSVPGLTSLTLPRPIVLVNGAFDLLHAGHMKLIFTARRHADGGSLVCALDSDERVAKAKGVGRPIFTYLERAAALGYMPIDYLVEITSDNDIKKLVQILKPDLRVQGSDYIDVPSKFPNINKVFVRSKGMRTSVIIERIKNARSDGV